MERLTTAKPVVAVVGATGHTGRFVVAELLRREMTPIAIARDPACVAIERLLEGKFRHPGASAPGFIFDADEMLASLGADNSTFKMIAA